VPSDRTEVTEITTGLAMLGFADLDRALATRPDWFVNVTDTQYSMLDDARRQGRFAEEFTVAWQTGRRFLASSDGLRGRIPDRLEWKGPRKPPGYDLIPADLQADHVYLVSCKYQSNILMNTSPPHLFDRRLVDRQGERYDWYLETAPEPFQALYEGCRRWVGVELPERVEQLETSHRQVLKRGLPKGGSWPDELRQPYQDFVNAVSHETAQRWKANVASDARREDLVWRMLRLQPAPYFVLGTSARHVPLHYRVSTPSEFRAAFDMVNFDSWNPVAGQPAVAWRAEVAERGTGRHRVVNGHVEVRWSQGRFGGFPEAKVYLDTPHHEVPGYVPLR